eukprot:CAMPEP_0185030206 /NCGR_PEP_ID=MMETSP1103-20130426/17010_1 /TAXON_ID=36769 /ORGANISM="Paraphysomonas bandaiensis, Strain Caron Lab Isolate" /LENGTH=206 /DNA_ID=CAMNT_0027565225 /DNA_START=26 /DNA_END=646 /DNA_ORIENTATION=+
MGPPGGGKGTISNKMVKDFSFDHISTGDLLRAHIRDGTELGQKVKGIMDKGGLVTDEVVLELLLDQSKKSSGNILLDGFPRTIAQAKLLSDSPIKIAAVIVLDIPHHVIVDRISKRWVHPASGRTYAYDYNPPKVHGLDDVTQEPLVQRSDDTPEAVKERLDKYEEVTSPLVEFYKKQGIAQVFSGTESNVIYPHVKQFCIDNLKL